MSRRNVYKVAVAYAAVAFVIIQVADLVFPAFSIGLWGYRLVIIVALLGFPVAIVLAWVFELTPSGVRVTGSSDKGSVQPRRGRLLLEATLTVVVLASVGIASWYLAGPRIQESPAGEVSIAILPFDSVGQDGSILFAEGIHDDLVTRLSTINGLRVIASGSTAAYRDEALPLADIASELNVNWVIRGNVQVVGEQAKLNIRLIDPLTSTQPWADSYIYDVTAANLFAAQSDIAHKVAAAVETRLAPNEEAAVNAAPTENLVAYRLFVEATTILRQREEPQMRRALELFQDATELDPDFALAWVGLADSILGLLDYGFELPAQSLAAAESAARRALDLDPTLADAHVSLGQYQHLKQNGRESIRELEKAIELRPRFGESFGKISWSGQILGRPDLAEAAAVKAMELDPLAVEARVNRAFTLLIKGDAVAALAIVRDSSDRIETWSTTQFYEGLILYYMGRYDEAVITLANLETPWAVNGPLSISALALVGAGRPDEAMVVLEQLRERDAHPFLIGLVTAALGNTEDALEIFDAIEDWDTNSDWSILAARYLFPDVLGEAREDSRYDRLLRRLDRAWGLVD